MKSIALIIFIVLFTGCSLTRKRYSAGWHIEWKKNYISRDERNEKDDNEKVFARQLRVVTGSDSTVYRHIPELKPDHPEEFLHEAPKEEVEVSPILPENYDDTLRNKAEPSPKIKRTDTPYPNKVLTKQQRGLRIALFVILIFYSSFLLVVPFSIGILGFALIAEAFATFTGSVLGGLFFTVITFFGTAAYFRLILPQFPTNKLFPTYGDRNWYYWRIAFIISAAVTLFLIALLAVFLFNAAF